MTIRSTILAVFAIVLTACSGGDDGRASAGDDTSPVQGGTAVVARLSDFDAFNQFVSQDSETGEVMRRMLFVPFVRLNADMEFEPYLAESMELSEDGLTLTFHIRDGMVWHDGEPVTAEDAVWSVEQYMNPELAYANIQYFRFVENVEQLDDRTVVFHFNTVHSDVFADFLDWQPMPKHLLEDVPLAEMKSAAFNRNPVGNGPFRFVSWTPNQQAVFEAFDDFPLGRPNLDRVVIRVIPDQTTQLTELVSGRLDFVRGVPPSESATVEEGDRSHLISYPGRAYTYLSWNGQNALFEDVEIRQALSMAIDRQEIVDALLFGYGRVATSDVMPFQWQFAEDIEPLPYDPDGARAILAENGWTDSNGDGILDKEGQPFRFTLETNQGNDLREDIIVIIQSDLRQVGIDAQPRLAEWNSLIDRLNDKDYEAVVSGWVVDTKFDPSETLTCDAGTYNFGSYCNPEADRLVEEALRTVDEEEARPLWHEYQEIVAHDQPYTFLYYLDERIGVSDRLRGVTADARGEMISIVDWYIPESLQ